MGVSGVQRLEFRLLGPLEVVRGGELVEPGPPQRRALLTYLLLHANEVVPRSRLVDALWGERPPARAATALQVHVHGLRKALGADRIETRGDGYLLRLEPDELDLERFRALLASGRPHEALALWRGSALAAAGDADFLPGDSARLEELRLAALEERIEADLASGGGSGLVAELEALVREHPFRERLRGLLMTALYRAGRQADALAAYRETRRTFVDELGLEPGPELQALEARMLRQDPALLPAAAGRLPAPATSFVGREREVGDVTGLLGHPGVRIVTLTGPGGTGKTRLALAAAAARPEAVFVDLSSTAGVEGVRRAVARALGVGEGAGRPLLEELLERLRGARTTLVLDNFEHVLEAAPFVGELVRGAPGLVVLVTSRSALRLSGEHEYPVPPLEEDDAVALFQARARAVVPERDQDRAAVAAVCARLDRLPLAIELAAARTKLFPPDLLLARLDDRLGLAGPVDVPERQRTLRAALDWSHDLLGPGEQALFRRLGVFAGSFTVADAEVVCDAGVADLEALVDHSLVRRTADGRLALLETIREYAVERLRASGEEDELRRRHADRFLVLAETADEVTFGGDQAGWWARLDLAHDDLRAALAWSAAAGDHERELRIGVALWSFWAVRGHWSEGRARLEVALARAGDADPALRARAEAAAGALAYRQGDLDAASERYESAHVLFVQLEDDVGVARMLGEFGNVAVARGEHERALARYDEARAVFRRLGLDSRVAKVTANMGAVANLRRDFERGTELLREAIDLQRAAEDRDGTAISTHNLARAELQLGRVETAAALFAESLEGARDLGYRELIAYTVEGVATVGATAGEGGRAARLAGAGRAMLAELGITLGADDEAAHERALHLLRERLGAAELERERTYGADLSVDEAVALALELARDVAGRVG